MATLELEDYETCYQVSSVLGKRPIMDMPDEQTRITAMLPIEDALAPVREWLDLPDLGGIHTIILVGWRKAETHGNT